MATRICIDNTLFVLLLMIICWANHKEEFGYSSLIDSAIIQNSYKLEDIDLLLSNVDLYPNGEQRIC